MASVCEVSALLISRLANCIRRSCGSGPRVMLAALGKSISSPFGIAITPASSIASISRTISLARPPWGFASSYFPTGHGRPNFFAKVASPVHPIRLKAWGQKQALNTATP